MGREIHVMTSTKSINAFVEKEKESIICFRCGQQGHVRSQCLMYKIRMCIHHEKGGCTDLNCTFAHGEKELRTPWRPRCVRVVKHTGTGKFMCIGCNSTEHTFRRCPLHQDLLFL